MTKRQKTGLWMLLSPFIAWFSILFLQIIVRFVISAGSGGSFADLMTRIINIFSIVIGGLTTIGFLPLIIIGIVFLATPEKK